MSHPFCDFISPRFKIRPSSTMQWSNSIKTHIYIFKNKNLNWNHPTASPTPSLVIPFQFSTGKLYACKQTVEGNILIAEYHSAWTLFSDGSVTTSERLGLEIAVKKFLGDNLNNWKDRQVNMTFMNYIFLYYIFTFWHKYLWILFSMCMCFFKAKSRLCQ